jgi:hypothetical protein
MMASWSRTVRQGKSLPCLLFVRSYSNTPHSPFHLPTSSQSTPTTQWKTIGVPPIPAAICIPPPTPTPIPTPFALAFAFPPIPAPGEYELGILAKLPIFSRSSFSCSMRARSAFVTRGLRVVEPPRLPGPVRGVPPRPTPATASRAELAARRPVPRVAPPREPRPRARLGAPSALVGG